MEISQNWNADIHFLFLTFHGLQEVQMTFHILFMRYESAWLCAQSIRCPILGLWSMVWWVAWLERSEIFLKINSKLFNTHSTHLQSNVIGPMLFLFSFPYSKFSCQNSTDSKKQMYFLNYKSYLNCNFKVSLLFFFKSVF